VSEAIVTVAVDTTTQRVLLVLAAVLIGASIGLLGALIVGAVKGLRATPGRATVAQMSGPPTARPRAAGERLPVPEPRAEPDGPASSPLVAPGMGSVPALYAVDSDIARDRHRELYDAEYVKQLDRVNALRRTIGTRLAMAGDAHRPAEEPDPSEELDA
jgi:hypothetical protein